MYAHMLLCELPARNFGLREDFRLWGMAILEGQAFVCSPH